MEFTREEVLSMYRSKRVDRVINGNEIYDVVLFPGERYFGGAVGPDSYGVYWQNASSGSIGGGCTIAPGYPPVIKSIIDWEKQVKFPDFLSGFIISLALKKRLLLCMKNQMQSKIFSTR